MHGVKRLWTWAKGALVRSQPQNERATSRPFQCLWADKWRCVGRAANEARIPGCTGFRPWSDRPSALTPSWRWASYDGRRRDSVSRHCNAEKWVRATLHIVNCYKTPPSIPTNNANPRSHTEALESHHREAFRALNCSTSCLAQGSGQRFTATTVYPQPIRSSKQEPSL